MQKINASILTCGVILALLTSCDINGDNSSSFTYIDPNSSSNVFVYNIDFSKKDDLSNLIQTFTDKTLSVKEIESVLKILNTNDLYANNSKLTIKESNLYDYSNNDNAETVFDANNFDSLLEMNLTRDNNNYNVVGDATLDYYGIDEDGTVKDYDINDGKYFVNIDITSSTIMQILDLKEETLNKEYSYYLTDYNLQNCLNLTQTDYFLDAINDIKSSTFYSENEKVFYGEIKDDLSINLGISAKKLFNVNSEETKPHTISYSTTVDIVLKDGMITKLVYSDLVEAEFTDNKESKLLEEKTITNELSII